MQLIEIYDSQDFRKNIFGALYFQPKRVIFIHHHDVPKDHLQGHRNVLRERLPETEIQFISVDFKSFKQLENAVDIIAKRKEPDTTLDLYGGEEIVNLYLKECCEKRDFDIINIDPIQKTIMKWDDGKYTIHHIKLPPITFREIVRLHGGDITGNMHTAPDSERFENIIRMGQYVFSNQKTWKMTTSFFQKAKAQNYFLDEYTIAAPIQFKSQNKKQHVDIATLKKLEENNFIYHLKVYKKHDREWVSLQIADEFSKEMLMTTGNWLEAFLYAVAKKSGFFSEVYQSVKIDWDGKETTYNVINEIDIILMKNEVPIFISCKMKDVNASALNELEVYASEFAGEYAKKVIATTDTIIENCSMYHRCRELDIQIIDIDKLTGKEVLAFYKNL